MGILALPAKAVLAQDNDDQDATASGEVVTLNEFQVTTEQDFGYRAANALTATRINSRIIDTPLTINVVTEEFIEDLNMDRIGEALRYTSGAMEDVLFSDTGGIRMRGQPIGSPFRNGYRRRRSISLDNLERVEVVKGPATVFFGQGNPGGIVNYVTKKPEFRNAAELEFKAGSYDFYKFRGDVQVALGENAGFRVIGSYEDSEDWRDFEFNEAEYIAPSFRIKPNEKIELSFEYEYRRQRINDSFVYLVYNPEFVENYASPPSDVVDHFRDTVSAPFRDPENDEFISEDYDATDEMVDAFLQGRWLHNEVRWMNDVQAARGEFERPWRGTNLAFNFHPSGTRMNVAGPDLFEVRDADSFTAEVVLRPTEWLKGRFGVNWTDSYFDEFNVPLRVSGDGTLNLARARGTPADNEDLTYQADLLTEFKTGGINHKFLIGTEYIDEEAQTFRYTVDYNQAEPVPDGIGGTLTGRDIFQKHNPFLQPPPRLDKIFTDLNPLAFSWAQTEGYYINHQGDLFEGRMHTMAGVRYVGFHGNNGDVHDTVPTGGATFKVVDGFALFGSYSKNFIPTIRLSATGGGVRPEEIFLLPPESAAGWDVGIKTNWKENILSGTLTFFQLERENIARNDISKRENDERNLDEDPNNDVFFVSSSGLERSQGMEMDMFWTPNENYQLLLSWSYTWEAKIVNDPALTPGTLDHQVMIGRRLRSAPEHLFSVFNRYKFTEGPLSGLALGLGARYTGEHGPLNHNATFNVINDDSLVLDGFIQYSTKLFEKPTTLQLNFENITDEFYISGNRSAGDPFKVFFTMRVEL